METLKLNINNAINLFSKKCLTIFSSQEDKKAKENADNQALEELYEQENAEAMATLIKRYGSEAEANKVLDKMSFEMNDFIDKMLAKHS
jgi:hypothetical protein